MSEPTLVVDLGTATSAAAIVAQGRTALLRDPYTGANSWPSAILAEDSGTGPRWLVGTAAERRKRAAPRRYLDGPRRALDTRTPLLVEQREVTATEALTAYLSAMSTEANEVYGLPIERLVLTVPAGYGTPDDRRDHLVAIGEAVGFRQVELVDSAVAVALDPQHALERPGLVLVVDLGVSWTVSLVHLGGDVPVQLAQHSAPTGVDLDTVLLSDLRAEGRSWVEPLLAAPGDAGLRAQHEAIDFVRRLKHRLAEAAEVQDHLTPLTPAYRLTRQWLEAFCAPSVAALVAGAQRVVEAAGATPADIGAVLVAGAAARLPITLTTLADALGQPLRGSAEPEFAAVRGAARWAAAAPDRVLTATPPGWRTEPVLWDLPPGPVWLLRWTVGEGEPYPAGAVLAEVRTADDLILGLTAPRAGSMVGVRPAPGTLLPPTLVVSARRPVQALAADPPPLLRTAETAGSYLLSADRHVLLECDPTGGSVRSTVAATGALLGVFEPDQPARHRGRIFVDPDGQPALITWDPQDGVSVWDVATGKPTVRIRDAVGDGRVLVDETGWRLALESEGRAAVGRYRRSTVTVWDLRTGALVEKATDGAWEQRHPQFQPRSGADGLTAVAAADELLATIEPGGLRLTATDGTELFRSAAPEGAHGRVAFDGDGRHLLVVWEREGWSRIDVHQI
ncbi:MAG TPA: Hsp70 family protein [Actinoplanes sp.]|nr:Hsp70 family protein [Actinoplanes sp.]